MTEQLALFTTEQWRPVRGYEGLYEVSDLGHVRSVERTVLRRNQPPAVRRGIPRKLVPLGPYKAVMLSREGKRKLCTVHRLVLEAFIGLPLPSYVACHNNGDGHDNRLENLRWDSQSSNVLDAVKHGTHPETRKTHCPKRHPYSPDNTSVDKRGKRRCLTCHREQERERHHRKRARAA